jgi:hypothetical protein
MTRMEHYTWRGVVDMLEITCISLGYPSADISWIAACLLLQFLSKCRHRLRGVFNCFWVVWLAGMRGNDGGRRLHFASHAWRVLCAGGRTSSLREGAVKWRFHRAAVSSLVCLTRFEVSHVLPQMKWKDFTGEVSTITF